MAFAQLASKLGPMLKSVASNKLQAAGSKAGQLGSKAGKAILGEEEYRFFKAFKDGGRMSKASLAKSFGEMAFEKTKQRAAEGGKASGLDPSESPIRSTLSGFFDPGTKTGKTAQSFLGSGVSASIENQLTQKAVAGAIKSVPSIIKGVPKAALGIQGKIAGLPFKPLGMGGKIGAMGARAAAMGGRLLGSAGELTGSQAGSAVGGQLAESAGEVAKNFKDIAKNPINPANWANLAKTLVTLPIKFQKLGESLVAANEKLAPFSAQLAIASAEFKMDEVRRNIQSAQTTGFRGRQMTESLSELKDELQPLKDAVTNIAYATLTYLLDIMKELVEFVKTILSIMQGIFRILSAPIRILPLDNFFKNMREAIGLGFLDAKEDKNPEHPITLSLDMMRTEFQGAGTMNKSSIGSWDTQTNNGTREDGTMGGSYNSPVDPNGGLSGINDMG